MPHNERHPNARTEQSTNRERVTDTHEAESAIARRGAGTHDPRDVWGNTSPTIRTDARATPTGNPDA